MSLLLILPAWLVLLALVAGLCAAARIGDSAAAASELPPAAQERRPRGRVAGDRHAPAGESRGRMPVGNIAA
jgi:hypothetical protein